MNHIYMLGLITNRGMRERFLHFFREYHIEVTFAALGRGTAGSALLDYLGMEDMGQILATGCGTPGMTARSPFMEHAYRLGRNLE